jgi:nicotinamide mononucleotide (NMN) deamidase PncC
MKAILSLAVALAGFLPILPAQALTADGLTYTLTAFATANPDVDNFTLTISGINGPSDTEGSRDGVFALAFNQPTGYMGVAPPSGFVTESGGLSSSGAGGCNGSGNFFCFQNILPIASSALAANSTLTYDFAVAATGISTWGTSNNPGDFKISWVGSNNNYDQVSENLAPAAAPEIDPASATAALTFLAGGLAMLGGRRRKS